VAVADVFFFLFAGVLSQRMSRRESEEEEEGV
jgi:hypothetical protein